MTNSITVREATPEDFMVLFGEEPPEDPWLLMVGERDGKFVGGGGIVWKNGHALGFFNIVARVPKAAIHRQVVMFLRDAKEAGIAPIYVWCDNLPTAKTWLTRLGFRPEGRERVWVWGA